MSLYKENKDFAVQSLLMHLPLLHPGNNEATEQYLTLLPHILAHSLEKSVHEEECRQLFSLAVVHPAFTHQEKGKLNHWLSHLTEKEEKSKEKRHNLALHHTLSDSSAHYNKGSQDSWRIQASNHILHGGQTNGWRPQTQAQTPPQQQQVPQMRKRLDHKDSGISTSFDELGSPASGGIFYHILFLFWKDSPFGNTATQCMPFRIIENFLKKCVNLYSINIRTLSEQKYFTG